MRIDSYPAVGVLQLQQQRAIVINDLFQPSGLRQVAERYPMAGGRPDLGGQGDGVDHVMQGEYFHKAGLVHYTVRAYVFAVFVKAVVVKVETVNFLFANGGLRACPCHFVAFTRMQGKYSTGGHVTGHCQSPARAEA
ncbi:hypothetical protein D3C81_1000190 [compost metagenome]